MKDTRPKGLFVGDLVAKTGFSRVLHGIIGNLTDEFNITGLGVNYRGDPHPYNFPIFPASSGGRIYGEDRLEVMLGSGFFDFVFILNDAWIVNTYLTMIKNRVKNPPKIIVYFPVDSKFHDPEWYKNFDIVTTAATYTEFGKFVVNSPDCAPSLDLKIVPHGVDTQTFFKKYTSREHAKRTLFGEKTEAASKFIFLNANRNQPRKRLDITMEAFSHLARKYDDVMLYLHCGAVDSHINVPKLALRYGIDTKLILTGGAVRGIQQVPEGLLNEIYNATDVGLNTGMGEGWGLTSMEHAVTGAAQIVPNHSACQELFKDCGLLVEPRLNYTFDNTNTVGSLVDPVNVAEAMERLYLDRALTEKLGNDSLNKFTAEVYTWKYISGTWKNIINEALAK